MNPTTYRQNGPRRFTATLNAGSRGGAIIFAASTYIAIRESRLARAKRARGVDDA